ncbi:MAG: TadE/TadG family type IV pilus assembly protein [Chloroflexia bacterium]
MKLTIRRRNRTEREHACTTDGGAKQRRRGQSMVELALLLPLLVLLLSVVVEGGLAFNAWVRVNTAARDATRFALDQGRVGDTTNLVLFKLKGIDFGSSREVTGSVNIDIYRIQGSTNSSGNIPNDTNHWDPQHIYGVNNAAPRISRTTIETKLKAGGANANNIDFIIVEVDFRYTPILGSLISPGTKLPMTSYAIIQQEPNN